MKNIMKKVICILISFTLLLMNNSTAFADDVKTDTSVKVINVTSYKVSNKNSGKYLSDMGTMIYDYAYSNDYYMSLRQSTNEKYVLTCSKTGKAYTNVDIVKLVKKVTGKTLYNAPQVSINYLDGKFYVIGVYKTKNSYQYFYMSTKDGTTYDYGKLINIPADDYDFYSGHLFKVGATYLFAFGRSDNDFRICKKDGNNTLYYTSTDLKTWKNATLPDYSTDVVWRLDVVTGTGVIVTDCGEREDDDMNHWYPMHMYYTTDFTTYTLITSDSFYSNPEASVSTLFGRTQLLRSEPLWNNDYTYLTGYQLFSSSDYKTMKVLFNYDSSKYDSNTLNIQRIGSRNKLSIFAEREKDNSLFVYSKTNNTFNEYYTTIRARLIGSGVYDGKDEYSYLVYNKNEILVSKDGFLTSYIIQTPMSYIQQLVIINDVITLQGENETYYIPIENIRNTINLNTQ